MAHAAELNASRRELRCESVPQVLRGPRPVGPVALQRLPDARLLAKLPKVTSATGPSYGLPCSSCNARSVLRRRRDIATVRSPLISPGGRSSVRRSASSGWTRPSGTTIRLLHPTQVGHADVVGSPVNGSIARAGPFLAVRARLVEGQVGSADWGERSVLSYAGRTQCEQDDRKRLPRNAQLHSTPHAWVPGTLARDSILSEGRPSSRTVGTAVGDLFVPPHYSRLFLRRNCASYR